MNDLARLLMTLPDPKPTEAAEVVPAPAPKAEPFSWSQRGAVGLSTDLDRVLALPRRNPEPPPSIAQEITERFRRPGGTMTLKPAQAFAIKEAEENRGLLTEIPVGTGKTLVTALAPMALGSKRIALLVPSSCVDQVHRMFAEYGRHFQVPNVVGGSAFFPDIDAQVRIIGHGEFSHPSQAGLPAEIAAWADLVVLDECHNYCDSSSTRTKRLFRMFKLNPALLLVAVSGTILKKSLEDFAYLVIRALKDRAPVPLAWSVIQEWAAAVDPGDWRAPPGELVRLCESPLEDVRIGYQRRLRETPGVVMPTVPGISQSLYIHKREVDAPPEVLAESKRLTETWCTSWGEECVSALDFHRYFTQVTVGLNYKRIWPNNEPEEDREEWLEARATWNRVVRDWLELGRPGMDSPHLCAVAAEGYDRVFDAYHRKPRHRSLKAILARLGREGRQFRHADEWRRWAAIKPKCKPGKTVVWYSDFLARDAAAWGREHIGIIWVEHLALAHRIAELGGFPKYLDAQADGLFYTDDGETRCIERGDRTIVLSRKSYGEGTDGLQKIFHKELETSIPAGGGKSWEQLRGRLHRPYQTKDEVHTWVYVHTPEVLKTYRKMLVSAQFLAEMTKKSQKALASTWTFDITSTI